MSLVTTTSESSSRSNRHNDPTSVVLPLPTGPPMPTRKARVTPLSRWRAGDARWNRSLCNGSCGMSCGGTGTPVFGEEDGERAGDVAGEVIGHAMNSRASRPPCRSPRISRSIDRIRLIVTVAAEMAIEPVAPKIHACECPIRAIERATTRPFGDRQHKRSIAGVVGTARPSPEVARSPLWNLPAHRDRPAVAVRAVVFEFDDAVAAPSARKPRRPQQTISASAAIKRPDQG